MPVAAQDVRPPALPVADRLAGEQSPEGSESARRRAVHARRHLQGHDGGRQTTDEETRRGEPRREEGTAADEGDLTRQHQPLRGRVRRDQSRVHRHALRVARQSEGEVRPSMLSGNKL